MLCKSPNLRQLAIIFCELKTLLLPNYLLGAERVVSCYRLCDDHTDSLLPETQIVFLPLFFLVDWKKLSTHITTDSNWSTSKITEKSILNFQYYTYSYKFPSHSSIFQNRISQMTASCPLNFPLGKYVGWYFCLYCSHAWRHHTTEWGCKEGMRVWTNRKKYILISSDIRL